MFVFFLLVMVKKKYIKIPFNLKTEKLTHLIIIEGVGKSTLIASLIKETFIPNV
jgi:ABC-type cobalamin/Fe3+-siderophores transport system ATPase subunit